MSERAIDSVVKAFRDRRGRFDYSTGWNRLCKCGHPLGEHLAAQPRACMNKACGCREFRKRGKEARHLRQSF